MVLMSTQLYVWRKRSAAPPQLSHCLVQVGPLTATSLMAIRAMAQSLLLNGVGVGSFLYRSKCELLIQYIPLWRGDLDGGRVSRARRRTR